MSTKQIQGVVWGGGVALTQGRPCGAPIGSPGAEPRWGPGGVDPETS